MNQSKFSPSVASTNRPWPFSVTPSLDTAKAVQALAALAQGSRLAIFRQLIVAGEGGMLPSQLSERLQLGASALSFHLKELLHADLVSQQRVGRSLIYRANFAHMNLLLQFLSDNCCAGAPCELDAPVCSVC